MEIVAFDIDGFHVGVGDSDATGAAVGIDLAAYLEPGLGCCRGNQLDDGLMADERFTAPVFGDVRRTGDVQSCSIY